MNEETNKDKLSRVELMAEGSETWDLSDNDIRAIDWVLSRLKDMYGLLMILAESGNLDGNQEILVRAAIARMK